MPPCAARRVSFHGCRNVGARAKRELATIAAHHVWQPALSTRAEDKPELQHNSVTSDSEKLVKLIVVARAFFRAETFGDKQNAILEPVLPPCADKKQIGRQASRDPCKCASRLAVHGRQAKYESTAISKSVAGICAVQRI